jgi:transcription-repair coupling factor (superfamily II helicase)
VDAAPQPGGVYLVAGPLREGWVLSDGNLSLTLLTDAELFGTVKERRYRRPRPQRSSAVVLSELVPGNYVVHVDHGVARFAGTTRMGEGGEQREYLVLEYADNDKLYVPTEHLDRVAAFVGAQDQPPTLTRLGGAEWARIKERVKGSTRELAQELLKLYAARQVAVGHEFSLDTVWQQELEDSFPYEETPDQSHTINEVKADMEQPRPMDRLICGDVGYGKTEVALRAAFKAVADGMQVGLLVPTTVLAQQHYTTFSERLSPFPLHLEVLSRFRTPKEQQEVVEGLQQGTVDIVIGTHRLLQKDVHFKNLGLVIVDEEQRFGVGHKEKLKQLRKEVDVLTLSATPIPRTLHMALSGIRDMSTIDTPPEARLPVKTFVSEYSDDVIQEAILREMERGGQAFFLHNRVKTIHQAAAHVAELVPQARILIGHGQMPESELEEVMLAFAKGEADVLICTTIIESGLDLPNVNTLIVDRADRLGLSQLYQLRGRVGRGDHRAYAYLLVPRGRHITEAAQQRLQAILEVSELGSGFRVAMRDLEIRGAGNLLGAAQSGHIHAVGLDLYGQLLQEAVRELAEEQSTTEAGVGPAAAQEETTSLPRIDLPLPAQIPEDYIPHLPTRLAIYQRLARITERGQVPQLREELRDRFGPLPQQVENLLLLVDLRALANTLSIESILCSGDTIVLALRKPVGGARVPLQRALGPSVSVGNQQMQLSLRQLGEQWLARLTRVLERLRVFQERLQSAA